MMTFVIEIDIRGLDGRGMFAVVDAAMTGAPASTMVRVKVGTDAPPAWIPWVQGPFSWQFVAENARTLSQWQELARTEVAA
jgi:hypothetical protein